MIHILQRTEHIQIPYGGTMSRLDIIKAAAQRQREGGNTAQKTIRDLKETVDLGDTFVHAVNEGDALGIGYRRVVLEKDFVTSLRTWYALSWSAWKEEIHILASLQGDLGQKAREVITVVEAFEGDPEIAETIAQVISEVIRPSRVILEAGRLTSFLNDMLVKGFVVEHKQKPLGIISFRWNDVFFAPGNTAVARRLAFPWIFRAFKQTMAQMQFDQRVSGKIRHLVNQTTMTNDPASQNLQRLLTRTTEVGTMVVFNDKSQVPIPGSKDFQNAGLLAVLIGRLTPGSSQLLLMDSVADLALPESMKGPYELPFMDVKEDVTQGMLQVRFVQAPGERMSREERNSVLQIQSLIKFWILREGRYRMQALPPGQNGIA